MDGAQFPRMKTALKEGAGRPQEQQIPPKWYGGIPISYCYIYNYLNHTGSVDIYWRGVGISSTWTKD